MTPRVRYALRLVTLGSLLASATLAATARSALAVEEAPTCAELREWARPYAQRQPTLDDLAPFDRAHRVAIFNAVTPEVRAALWAEQLRRLLRRTDLSDVQRTYLRRAVALATPDHYRGATPATSAFEPLRAEAARVFATPAYRAALSQLGSVAVTGAVAIERLTSLKRGINCDCRSTFDCFGSPCGPAGGCTGVIGCGLHTDLWCNGRCQF